MKRLYKRNAWLIDEDVLLVGYMAKRKFYPNNTGCGFSHQEIRKRDIGKILFLNEAEAIAKTGLRVRD